MHTVNLRHDAAHGGALHAQGIYMNEGLLKQVLNCTSLPSLPAVAVRVIELTSDKNVKVQELAKTIGHDQGLSTKILRTVNSSFYGVRTRVATIDKAIVMLGLAPVKVLALGFSLVSSVGEDESGFDYVSYWRRGLYTAVAAKLIAEAAEAGSADECFLGGLLQDVGMVALHRTLGRITSRWCRARGTIATWGRRSWKSWTRRTRTSGRCCARSGGCRMN